MSTVACPRSEFEARIDEIRGLIALHFQRLGPEAREEAEQNSPGLAWKYWLRLVQQGKAGDEAVFKSMIWWAVKHTKQGRMPQGRGSLKSKCAVDYASRGLVGRQFDFNLHGVVGDVTSVPDQVAYRIDVPEFLATLSDKNRALAHDLSSGMTTGEVAKKHGVTAGAISQFRTRFRRWYEEFHGEI